MLEDAKERGIEANIWAVGDGKTKDEHSKADIIMIGPQLKYRQKGINELVNGEKPVVVIDMMKYGRLNGKAILDDAIKALAEFKK